MACRLYNRSSNLLRVDLRGGGTLQLAPGATSSAIAEELLYDNMFLRQWENDGLIIRLPAKFVETAAPAKMSGASQRPADPKPKADAVDKKDRKKSEKSKGSGQE